jgi:tetratricopeptide (TPR) repeat protein
LAREGQAAEAAHAFEEATSLARSMPYPYAEGRALYEHGLLLARHGRIDGARDLLERALSLFRRIESRLYVEWTEQALAALDGGAPTDGKEQ